MDRLCALQCCKWVGLGVRFGISQGMALFRGIKALGPHAQFRGKVG